MSGVIYITKPRYRVTPGCTVADRGRLYRTGHIFEDGDLPEAVVEDLIKSRHIVPIDSKVLEQRVNEAPMPPGVENMMPLIFTDEGEKSRPETKIRLSGLEKKEDAPVVVLPKKGKKSQKASQPKSPFVYDPEDLKEAGIDVLNAMLIAAVDSDPNCGIEVPEGGYPDDQRQDVIKLLSKDFEQRN